MDRKLTRRRFLAGAVAASWAALQTGAVLGQDAPFSGKTLDIHVHLFGVGDTTSGCRLSKAASNGPLFQCLASRLGLRQRARTSDEGYVLALAEQVEKSGLAKAVILAQDAAYDDRGQPDWERTNFYVPNDYVFQVTARWPQRMIPCVSINPQRADAIAELDRCAEKGARLLKIHPSTQDVDIADRKHVSFFRRCADLQMVVMVHTGHEHAAPLVNNQLADPRKLELALDTGCTVVACHCGTGRAQDTPDMLPAFLAMVRKYKNLWGDTAVLGDAGRVRDFRRLLDNHEVRERLLHGSDFPFPPVPLAFAGILGLNKAWSLQKVQNWIEQDLALKEALGIGRASAERAYRFVADRCLRGAA